MPAPIDPANQGPLSSDQLVELLADRVLEAIDAGNGTPIVLIDGRAGSGKSTLAAALQNRLFKEGESLPRVIHMDDLYLGWTGLEAGVDQLQRFILAPLRAGKTASWQEFDWALGRRERWREFAGGTPLIIEGVGALNGGSAEMTELRVWLEVPEDVRHERWVTRDGHAFDEFWAPWAVQEIEFYEREKSPELATLLGGGF